MKKQNGFVWKLRCEKCGKEYGERTKGFNTRYDHFGNVVKLCKKCGGNLFFAVVKKHEQAKS